MKIGDKYEITSDRFQWILTERYMGKDNKGNDKEHTRESYYATLEQCCNQIVQRDAKQAETVEQVVTAILESTWLIRQACKGITKEMAA